MRRTHRRRLNMPRNITLVWIIATLGALALLIALGVPSWLRYTAIVAWSLVWWRYRWLTGGHERYKDAVSKAQERRRRQRPSDDPDDTDPPAS